MPRRRKKALSEKQRRFVEGVADGKSDKQAAMDAGYSFSMAENAKARIWSQPEVEAYFRDLMRKAAPPKRLVKRISEHIDGRSITTKIRKRTVPSSDPAKGGEEVEETTMERIETVDAGVSLRAIEMAVQYGEYVPERTGTPFGVAIGVTLEPAILDSAKTWEPPTWAQRMKAQGDIKSRCAT